MHFQVFLGRLKVIFFKGWGGGGRVGPHLDAGCGKTGILGLQIFSSLSWRDHIVQIAKSASKKLGVLFRCKYFNSA